MRFDYIHGQQIDALYAPLAAKLHAERQGLEPQTPQTIVVGNLDTETYLQQKIIADDGVLMGVNFPFLESAIENFYTRLRFDLPPAANESWFTTVAEPPEASRPLTMFDLEMVMLGILQDPQHESIVNSLGYDTKKLSPARASALAYKLAGEWYDYLLHIPDLIFSLNKNRTPELSAAGDMWNVISHRLHGAGYKSPLFAPAEYPSIAKAPLANQGGLFLFGMPMLSAYHLRAVAGIARVVPVTLIAQDFETLKVYDDSLLRLVGQKYGRYRNALKTAAKTAKVILHIEEITTKRESDMQLSICALPGLWRAAEVFGDICHDALLADANLHQTEIGVALSNADAQFAAFERACGMRALTATCRATAITAPHDTVELWQILAKAADSGVDRELVLRYWQNAVVKATYDLTSETIETWRLVLERSQGYRNDYPSEQSAFSFDTAMDRIARSVFFCDMQSALPPLRLSDSPAQTEIFTRSVAVLLDASKNIGQLRGRSLFAAMRRLGNESGFDNAPGYAVFSIFLDKLEAVPGAEFLFLSQVVSAADRHISGADLQHTSARDGIAFTKLFATCFSRKVQILFDLNDSVTTRDDDTQLMIAQYRQADTRLSPDEQLAVALVTAAMSANQRLILAYSDVDPKSGAQFYPSQMLSKFRETTATLGLKLSDTLQFAPTVVDTTTAPLYPVAAEDDLQTLYQLNSGTAPTAGNLTQILLPSPPATEPTSGVTLRELFAFICNPVLHILSQTVTLPEEPAEFRFVEPRLAFSKSARTSFCENYLEYALTAQQPLVAPTDFVKNLQQRGELPAGGFDQALQLLGQHENAARLREFAESLPVQYKRLDISFTEGISEPFVKQDSERLDRWYFPAPSIGGIVVTGEISGLLLDTATGDIMRLASGLQQKRISRITELYLALCLLQLCGSANTLSGNFSYAEYAIEGPKSNPDRLDARIKNVSPLNASALNPAAYFSQLLTSYARRDIFWFDLFSLSGTSYANLADLSAERLIDSQELDSEFARRPARSVFLKRFFGLNADHRSVNFFNEFVRPLAAATAAANEGRQTTKGKAR